MSERAVREEALLYAIGALTMLALNQRLEADRYLPGSVADALKREADKYEVHAEALVRILHDGWVPNP